MIRITLGYHLHSTLYCMYCVCLLPPILQSSPLPYAGKLLIRLLGLCTVHTPNIAHIRHIYATAHCKQAVMLPRLLCRTYSRSVTLFPFSMLFSPASSILPSPTSLHSSPTFPHSPLPSPNYPLFSLHSPPSTLLSPLSALSSLLPHLPPPQTPLGSTGE